MLVSFRWRGRHWLETPWPYLAAARIDLDRETPPWLASALGPNPAALRRRFWTFRIVPLSTRQESQPPNEQILFRYIPPINGSSRTVDRCVPGRLI